MSDVIISPSTRRFAAERGVDIDALAKRLGRTTLTRDDILAAGTTAPQPAASSLWDVDHAAWGPVREEPLTKLAQRSASNLLAAHSLIPAVTHHDSADVTRIEALRASLRSEGRKITALAFHVAVLARCLREFPRFNASLSAAGDRLILKSYIHIGIAVDTPYGLVVPVLRDADQKRVGQISDEIADLAKRAQARKLRPTEMGGGSMSISNLGGIGGEAFTPIINPPELAILGLTRTEVRPVWDGTAFLPRPKVPLDLSYDHRVINGADAARFFARNRDLIANPDELLTLPQR